MSRSHDWVRIADAARVTGIPARTIRWWAERRKIPFAQIGGPRTWLLVYLPALNRPGVNPIETEDRDRGTTAKIGTPENASCLGGTD